MKFDSINVLRKKVCFRDGIVNRGLKLFSQDILGMIVILTSNVAALIFTCRGNNQQYISTCESSP